MRLLLTTLITAFFLSPIVWKTDIEKAEQTAKTENKLILLNFSGSDWCGPCIRLEKDIFDSEVFTNFATDQLVLVNADFPRSRKNQLSKEQQKRNEELADMYNKNGVFPLTLLLNADGKVLKEWQGFPKESAGEFTNEIKALTNASK